MAGAPHVLLRAIVDYAGTFPPAGLDLAAAIDRYRRARSSPYAWILGRFVLPWAMLDDFERLTLSSGLAAEPSTWPLSVIVPATTLAIGEELSTFIERSSGRALVSSVEWGPLGVADIARAAGWTDLLRGGVETFFEVPIDAALDDRVAAIAGCGGSAKIRTGGIVPDAFPSTVDIVRFLRACAAAGVPFKATAGLHHALCGYHALTYEVGSVCAWMHGFLNVAVAAALIHSGAPVELAAQALDESSVGAFGFGAQGVTYRERQIGPAQLAATRTEFFRSFGSCAFDEPVWELERLEIL